MGFYRAGTRGAATSSRASSRRSPASSWRRASSTAPRKSPRRAPPAPPIASATSIWRRGSRSSSGAASRTTSCSTSRSKDGCAIRRCSSSRSGACWPTRRRTRSSTNFAGQWLYLRELRHVQTEAKNFDENLRQSFRRETEMLFGDDRPRGSQPHRPDRRRLHVRGRAARAPLRHPERPAAATSGASRSTRRQPAPRAARAGQHADRDLGRHAHVAGRRAASGFWRTCSARRRRSRRPASRRTSSRRAKPRRPARCGSGWKRIAPARSARRATASWTRWGSRSRTSIWSATWREYDGPTTIDSTGPACRRHAAQRARRSAAGRAEPVGRVHDDRHRKSCCTYALGRPVHYYDMPTVRGIVRRAAANDNRFSSLVLGIIESDAFQKRIKK